MVGLVLEGGGMRGIYTAGVLECFLDEGINFNYIVGVSAGACHACSYISRQNGRNLKIAKYYSDKRYMGIGNYVKYKSLFGMEFIFKELAQNLIPFDYDEFFGSENKFYVGTVDINTGKSKYFEKSEITKDFLPVRASMSIPGITNIITINNEEYLDGGISSPIPIEKSIEDGNLKNVIVLTQSAGYIKQPQKISRYMKLKYRKYPQLLRAMEIRHEVYNDTIKYINNLEKCGDAIVIRPTQNLNIGRLQKDYDCLEKQYELGYNDAKCVINKIQDFNIAQGK